MILDRELRMEAWFDTCRPTLAEVVQATRRKFTRRVRMHLQLITKAAVYAGATLQGLNICLRVKLIPALVCPALSTWTPFHRCMVEGTLKKAFNGRGPGVYINCVGKFSRIRKNTCLRQKII
jgi:hypothetical protein